MKQFNVPIIYRSPLIAAIKNKRKQEDKMKKAAKDLDFISAAQYRDELFALKKKYKEAF